MSDLRQRTFLHGALILTAAGLFSKLLGALYRIPFARLVGSEGMGLYQMAYPIYTLLLALSTAGIPVAISKLVAERKARGDEQAAHFVFRVAVVILIFIGLLLTVSLIFSARFWATYVVHDTRSYYAIVAIAPALFFASVMSAFRGYFQGLQFMAPTALSQGLEQLVRVVTVFAAAVYLMPFGVEFAAAGATFGAVTGGLAGLALLSLIYFSWQRRFSPRSVLRRQEGARMIATQLLFLAGPISLGGLVLPLVQMLDTIIVPSRLQAGGATMTEATVLFGQLSGMAGALINLPAVITISLASTLVPAVAEAAVKRQYQLVGARLNAALRFTLFITLPAATGLMILAGPICQLLYDLPEVGAPLAVLAPSVVFLGLYQATTGVLQGMGRAVLPVINLLVGVLLKIYLTYSLTAIPDWGIEGAALATVSCFAAASMMNIFTLCLLTRSRIRWKGLLLKPVLAVTIMAIGVNYFYPALLTKMGENWATLGAVIAGGIFYSISLLALGGVTVRDLQALPGMSPKIIEILRFFRLIRE